jgi:hypothetical protein
MIGDDQHYRMKATSQNPGYNCEIAPNERFLIDTERYDDDHGEGAMQKVVTKIREERRQAA